MSNHWNLYCVTCAVPLDRNGNIGSGWFRLWWNHRDDEARAVAKALPQIIALDDARIAYDLAAGPRSPDFDVGFYLHNNSDAGVRIGELAAWARGHVGHDVRAIDEYGQIDNTCGESYDCGSCGAGRYCALDRDHGGDHDHRRPT